MVNDKQYSRRSFLKGTAAMFFLGGCADVTRQTETIIDGNLANKLRNFDLYDLGTKSVVLDHKDNIPYNKGRSVSVNVNDLIGKKAIIHSDESERDLGATVLMKSINPEETYRMNCPVNYDEKTKLTISWGKCSESITKPNEGGDSSGGSSEGGSGGGGNGGGGGPSGGGGD